MLHNKFLTAKEAAQYLKVCTATIYRKANAGEIPGVKIGRVWRFPKQALSEWAKNRSERNFSWQPQPSSQLRTGHRLLHLAGFWKDAPEGEIDQMVSDIYARRRDQKVRRTMLD